MADPRNARGIPVECFASDIEPQPMLTRARLTVDIAPGAGYRP
ncbi:MAG: hypothetical protein ACPGID_11890 [Rubricella sp.]